eukprot:CAMPEP_0114116664 /NCGR_PEP_ID=MMETSP0043_2-20121206/4616_1 /TAXON_ID=464988 /ORGANISM="Hemiselmis andersenii, Strain CCMP644" /LENGTH=196 /DNA_ID=CAMNT_0001208995 /DNA_START=68 /DNA_END=658 /DNA_ORIENTATION=-
MTDKEVRDHVLHHPRFRYDKVVGCHKVALQAVHHHQRRWNAPDPLQSPNPQPCPARCILSFSYQGPKPVQKRVAIAALPPHVLPPRPKTSSTPRDAAAFLARVNKLAEPDPRKRRPPVSFRGGSQTERGVPAGCWVTQDLPRYQGALFSLSCKMRNGSAELPTFSSWSLHHGRVVAGAQVTMDDLLFETVKRRDRL